MSFKVNPSVADIRKKYKVGDLLQLWHTGLSGMAMPAGVWRLTPRGLILAESTHGQDPGITWGEFQRLFKMDNGYNPGIAKVKRVAAEAAHSNPRRRRNPDLSGALTIAHEASGDVVIRHVAHNPRKRRNPLQPLPGETQQAHMARWKAEAIKRLVKNTQFWINAGYPKKEAWAKATAQTVAGPVILAAAWSELEDSKRSNPARRISLDKASPKRRRNPHQHPEWVQQALKAGASLLEGGEHGFYSVKVGRHWITEADTPEGELTLGSGDREISVLPEAEAVAWIRQHKRAVAKKAGPLVMKRRRNPALDSAAADIVQQALARYGASLTPEGFIQKGDKTLSVSITQKGKKLCIEGGGRLLASGPITEKTVQSFVEGFWFWKKANPRRNPSAAHAAPSVSAAVCGKIHRLTQDNDHTGALLVLARDVLRSPTFTKKVAAIQSAQKRAGYLTDALNTKRNALSARMFAQAKRRLGAADYALLRRSF